MWTLLQQGDAAIVPSPSYPIHIYGPLFAGADLRQVAMSPGVDTLERLHQAYDIGWPKPRVLVISFPHNPTGRASTSSSCSASSTSAASAR